jgi:alpha-glucosidase/alpha-D-xyloside xylohydrolase
MPTCFSRRQALAAGLFTLRRIGRAQQPARVAGQEVEIRIAPVSESAVRLTIAPLRNGQTTPVPLDGSLIQANWKQPRARLMGTFPDQTVEVGAMKVRITPEPLVFIFEDSSGRSVQTLRIDRESGIVSFLTGDAPLLGLGEGGPQFDRRNSIDPMKSGQGGYRLRTHGGRVPIPWIIGTSGWAMFFHQPFGTFEFIGTESRFLPLNKQSALPLDIFFIASRDPSRIIAEHARLTGFAQLPPLWSLGYLQSHRTLASRDELIKEAKTFREKKLPCDAMIYLGTGFCPSGWNTANGSFSFNRRVFPDPKAQIDELHNFGFKVVLHHVILADDLRGTVADRCPVDRFDEEQASCQWDAHRRSSR